MNAKQSLFAGALGAIGASACCVLPLMLVSLGIGGAWKATVDFQAREAKVSFDDAKTNPEKLMQATKNAGYPSTLKGAAK